MELETVIGLEIHVQISTKTKMFTRVSNDSFDKEPNVNTSPFCMGFPGLLPVINKEAVYKGVKTALALNCEIPEYCKFDRKNYFYPDNPKGYQISQFDEPLSINGYIDVELGDKDQKRTVKIGITRLHLEDDAGKLTHVRDGSLVDFNRAGTPLMEIVSEPDIRTAEEAVAYAKEIQNIVRYVDSSEADMEKGMMRFDASVSLRPVGDQKLYARAEIKNLNSFRALENAINFEIKRQSKLWEEDNPQADAVTVGWSDEKSETYFMREKEDSDDYRYFPEPDLPPLHLPADLVDKYRSELPEMPRVKRERYVKELGLAEDDARILVEDLKLAQYFEEVVSFSGNVKRSISFVNSVLLKYLKQDLIGVNDQKISARMLGDLIKLVDQGLISNSVAKGEVFEEMYSTGLSAQEIVDKKGLKQVSDSGVLEEVCKKIVQENTKSVEDFKNGKDRALGYLVGQVMKEMKGQANPQMVNEIITRLLSEA